MALYDGLPCARFSTETDSTDPGVKIKMLTKLSTPVDQTSWAIGNQSVVLGDCLAVLRTMEPASVDAIVTSPPYNIGVAYKSYDDNRPRKAYLSWLRRVSKQLSRVLKADGSFFLNAGSTSVDPWVAMDVAGAFRDEFILQNNIAWVKSISLSDQSFGHFKPINSRRFLNQNHESLFHFTKSGAVPLDRLSVGVPFKDKSNIARWGHAVDKRCAGNVWFVPYKTVQSKAEKFDHPAGFPVGLPERCMLLHGKEDMLVLDPFAGAGATLVAAERLGHRGIGIEIDPHYAETCVSRLEAEGTHGQGRADDRRSRVVARGVDSGVADLVAGCP